MDEKGKLQKRSEKADGDTTITAIAEYPTSYALRCEGNWRGSQLQEREEEESPAATDFKAGSPRKEEREEEILVAVVADWLGTKHSPRLWSRCWRGSG